MIASSANKGKFMKYFGKSIKYINVAGPEYRGASVPQFDPKSINESKFEDGLRYKECNAYIDIDDQIGYVRWLAQENDNPSYAWETEIKRAFKENGLKDGSTIHIEFGSIDTGYAYKYDMTI